MARIRVSFGLKDDDWKRYQEKLTLFPEKVKKAVNEYMHGDVREKMINSITGEMPISDRKKTGQRAHAKNSQWYVSFNFDQAVTIQNKLAGNKNTSFYYLFFPHEGTVSNKGKLKIRPNPFMERAVEKEYNEVITGLFNVIDREIKEDL